MFLSFVLSSGAMETTFTGFDLYTRAHMELQSWDGSMNGRGWNITPPTGKKL